MQFFIACGILAIVLAIGAVFVRKLAFTDDKSDVAGYLSKLEGFSSTKNFMGVDGKSGIAVDEKTRKICLITKGERFSSMIISHQELLSTEISEDGLPIAQVSRGSQIGGAMIEGLIAGAEGTSDAEPAKTDENAQKDTSGKVRRIELNVLVNNIKDPLHTVVFSNIENERGSVAYSISATAARQWHSRLCVMIQQADNEDENAVNQAGAGNENQFVADEIFKLSELMKEGLITEEEFYLQKAKLIKET